VVKRLGTHRRHAWPDTLVSLRGARHGASPAVMPWIDAPPDLPSVTGFTSQAVVQKLAREVGAQAKRAEGSSGRKGTRCHSTRDHAQPWSRSRRVGSKVEGSEQGVTTRFVVTDREPARPHVLSQHRSCARGHAENASQDHTRSLQSARPACHRFAAHQCRWLLHAAAYVFLET